MAQQYTRLGSRDSLSKSLKHDIISTKHFACHKLSLDSRDLPNHVQSPNTHNTISSEHIVYRQDTIIYSN